MFALLFGTSLKISGKAGERVAAFFQDVNVVIMKLIIMIMALAPYGVFFLVSALFARMGFHLITDLLYYFFGTLRNDGAGGGLNWASVVAFTPSPMPSIYFVLSYVCHILQHFDCCWQVKPGDVFQKNVSRSIICVLSFK